MGQNGETIMEIARMDYRFTAILIVLLCLLAVFGGPPGY